MGVDKFTSKLSEQAVKALRPHHTDLENITLSMLASHPRMSQRPLLFPGDSVWPRAYYLPQFHQASGGRWLTNMRAKNDERRGYADPPKMGKNPNEEKYGKVS